MACGVCQLVFPAASDRAVKLSCTHLPDFSLLGITVLVIVLASSGGRDVGRLLFLHFILILITLLILIRIVLLALLLPRGGLFLSQLASEVLVEEELKQSRSAFASQGGITTVHT
jgi:hypothetical protein